MITTAQITARILLSAICFLLLAVSNAQRTVGVFYHDERAYNGYTMFSQIGGTSTYLIDNCGYLVHEWPSQFKPGLSGYLMDDGSIFRGAQIGSSFNSGGASGRIEHISWEGELLWGYNYSSDEFHQHHDIEPLPNGNVLVVAWQKISLNDAVAFGRNPDNITSSGLWPLHIVELRPIGSADAEIVWLWRLPDHLVQEFDSTKANYAVVKDHPELVNINYTGTFESGFGVDWIHTNSIDYHPELDQILVSSRNFNEIWIIDHSTTTEEAAGHSGGRWGKGGDLLYRWGNPQAYQQSQGNDRLLFGQHDARWIVEGPNAGDIQVFNNGVQRPEGQYSEVLRISPPWNGMSYVKEDALPFGPLAPSWLYELPSEYYASSLSGAQDLPNGNVLICLGPRGTFLEVIDDGTLVWKYICPITGGDPIEQGQQPNGNNVFRSTRYSPQHPALIGRNLNPIALLELNPLTDSCEIIDTMTSFGQDVAHNIPVLRGNISSQAPLLELPDLGQYKVAVVDISGRIVHIGDYYGRHDIPLQLPAGASRLYYVVVNQTSTHARWVFRGVKP